MVEIDYRSLGAPTVTSDQVDQLESNWKAVLPGFDKTAHHIDNVIVTVEPDELKAVARSQILAYHFIKNAVDGESWTLMGNYEHGLERAGL